MKRRRQITRTLKWMSVVSQAKHYVCLIIGARQIWNSLRRQSSSAKNQPFWKLISGRMSRLLGYILIRERESWRVSFEFVQFVECAQLCWLWFAVRGLCVCVFNDWYQSSQIIECWPSFFLFQTIRRVCVPAGVRQVRLLGSAVLATPGPWRLPVPVPELLELVLVVLQLPRGNWSRGRLPPVSWWWSPVLAVPPPLLLLLSVVVVLPSLHPSRPGESPLLLPICPPPTTGGNLCNSGKRKD